MRNQTSSRGKIWVLFEEGGTIARLGMSDYLQRTSGDVAFAEARPAGATLAEGDEFASIETIKVAIGLVSPVSGAVLEANPALKSAPEILNQDPYGEGWIVRVRLAGPPPARLLDPPAYLTLMTGQAEEEAKGR
jgi:glycine cleavage system H protein